MCIKGNATGLNILYLCYDGFKLLRKLFYHPYNLELKFIYLIPRLTFFTYLFIYSSQILTIISKKPKLEFSLIHQDRDEIIFLSNCVSLNPSIYLFDYPSSYQYLCLNIYLSTLICLSICNIKPKK